MIHHGLRGYNSQLPSFSFHRYKSRANTIIATEIPIMPPQIIPNQNALLITSITIPPMSFSHLRRFVIYVQAFKFTQTVLKSFNVYDVYIIQKKTTIIIRIIHQDICIIPCIRFDNVQRGIRTLEANTLSSFQDCHLRPLGHLHKNGPIIRALYNNRQPIFILL